MPNSPTLGLSLMTAAQSQKEVVFNNFLIAMDALFKGSVLDATLTTPPGSPALGDAYIVGGVGAGLWSGHNFAVAFYFNGWQFISPSIKLRLYSIAQSSFYVYQNSTLHWVAEPASTVSVLADLTNVEGSPVDGDVLTWVNADGKWKGKTLVYPSTTLHALTDVNVTEGAPIDGYALAWNQSSGRWIAAQFLSTPPNFFTLPAIDLTGVAAGSLATYQPTGGPAGGPRINFTAASSLALVDDLGQVGDVAYPSGGSPDIGTGAYLQWDGAAWVPSTSAVVYSWAGIVDGPGTFTGNALKLVRVNSIEDAIEYFDASALAGATHLDDLLDVLSTSPSNTQVLAWNNGASQWEPATVAAVAYSGAYSDLSGRPSLATVATSGAYADLSGRPTIPTNASFTLSALGDVNITGGLSNGNVLEWNSTDSRWEPGSATGVSTLVALTDTNISTGSGVDGYVVYWDNGTGKFKLKAAGGGALSALTDVNVTEGSGIDGLFLKWNNGTSRWIASALTLAADTDTFFSSLTDGDLLTYNSGASKWENIQPAAKALSGLSDVTLTSPSNNQILKFDLASGKWINATNTATFALALKNNGTTVESATTSIDFINATSVTTTSGAVVVTLPTGGGGGGGGAGGTMTPPTVAGLTAVTNLGSATLTDRTTSVLIPALNIRPDVGASNSTLYCALEAVPVGNFTLTLKFLMTIWNISGGWYGGGLVLHNSGNGNNIYMMRLTATSPVIYLTKWTAGFTSNTFTGGQFIQDEDYFMHIDYDGTNYIFGASRNGLDKIQFFTEAVATFLGAITHVGIGWSGAYSLTNGPLFDFQHYHSGAAGSSGL